MGGWATAQSYKISVIQEAVLWEQYLGIGHRILLYMIENVVVLRDCMSVFTLLMYDGVSIYPLLKDHIMESECANFKFILQRCHIIHASITLPTLVIFLLLLCLLLLHHCFIFSPLFQLLHQYLLRGVLLCSSSSYKQSDIRAAIVFVIIVLP